MNILIYGYIQSLFNAEIVSRCLLLPVQNRLKLVDSWTIVGGISSEGDSKHVQKFVHSIHKALRRVGHTLDSGLSIINDDLISKIGSHNEVVLDHKGCFLVV
jgi:hypothetical protein